MTDQEQREADQYRFSGYTLDLITMDETGPSYAVARPHPYYYNQPAYWQKNAYKGDTFASAEVVGGDINIERGGVGVSQSELLHNPNYTIYRPIMFRMLSF